MLKFVYEFILVENSMKVLMVINNMRADSGVCSSVAGVSNELIKQGHEVFLAYHHEKGSVKSKRFQIEKKNIFDLSTRKNILSKILKLHKIIKEHKIDITHTHMHQPGIVGRLAAIGTQSATVTTEHSTHLPAKNWFNGIKENIVDGFLARRTHFLIAVSESAAATFAARTNILPNKIEVIYNTIDLDYLADKDSGDSLNEQGLKKILFVGRFAYEKNAKLSIEILEKLIQKNKPVKLIVAGGGDLHGDLLRLIDKKNMAEHIDFVGVVTNIKSLMENSDMLLLTSFWEGCPMSIIEAYASGLAVVATRVPGVIDIVDHKTSGILIDPKDSSDAAEVVEDVLFNSKESLGLVKNAREKIAAFLPQKITDDHIKAYEKAIKNKHGIKS